MAFNLQDSLKSLGLGRFAGKLQLAPPMKPAKMPEKPVLSPIGVDFGAGSLKVLQVMQGTFKEPARLVYAATVPTPPELLGKDADRLAFQVDALHAIVRAGGFKGKRAMCVVSSRRTFVQHIQVPVVGAGTVADRVRDQILTQASCGPESLIVRHVEAGEVKRQGQMKVEAICFILPRQTVLGHMDALRSAKLDPVGIHSEHQALVRTFDPITKRDEDDELTSLYADLGATTTKLVIAHGRRIVLAKTVHVGWAHLRGKGIQGPVQGGTLAQFAAGSKHEPSTASEAPPETPAPMTGDVPVDRRTGAPAPGMIGLPEADPNAPAPKTLSAVEQLTDEIGMGLRYHAAMFPKRTVGRTVFVGGGACDMDLCRHIAKKLRLAAQIADPISTVDPCGRTELNGLDLTIPQPGWAVPLGLCLSPTDL